MPRPHVLRLALPWLTAIAAIAVAAPRTALAAPVVVKTFDLTGSGSCARMRMGDLNGDGRLDFLMVQPTDDNPSYVAMLTAYDGFTGKRLWQVGSDNGLTGTDRDEPARIYDIDSDGQYATAGCIEVCGGPEGFVAFNRLLVSLSGTTKPTFAQQLKEIGDSACMTVTYLPATPPPVRPR